MSEDTTPYETAERTVDEYIEAIRHADLTLTDPYDLHDWIANALALLNDRLPTPVEPGPVMEERCSECGLDRRGVIHDGRWVKADGSGHEFVPPVEASRTPVEPTEHDTCGRCGAPWLETSLYLVRPVAQHWCIPQDDGDVPHVFVEPVPPSSEPPREEAGGWKRVGEIGHGDVHWRNEARDIDAIVPPAVEAAIRAPLEAEVARLREAGRISAGIITRFMASDQEWRRAAETVTEYGSDSCPNCGSEFVEGCAAAKCAYYPLRALLESLDARALTPDEGGRPAPDTEAR